MLKGRIGDFLASSVVNSEVETFKSNAESQCHTLSQEKPAMIIDLDREPLEDLEEHLLAIRYRRGVLQLLDQRKLPLETTYLDIKSVSDAWSAIRDGVVRGTPAVAIAAALSLVVELCDLKSFSYTPYVAMSFVAEKLDYLVSSRREDANLFRAAEKLKFVTRPAISTRSAMLVYKAYIDAAERMLEEEVDSNKAIGSHGSTFLLNKLKESKKIAVLTHGNTGSLATAGYGTAVGVIRALHVKGVLEMAYCAETRPSNQGSRLTASELVYDKIPTTLIADSAVAALMKARRVNAVIVGADRVAANGDTSNTIGTYTLALCAKRHGVPFFVAASLDSIDLSISSGKEIVIEERSPEEELNTRGGLGERVAASGIAVWNPALDVTPASIITGIITDEGVVTKNETGTFGVEGFTKLLEQRNKKRTLGRRRRYTNQDCSSTS